MFEKIKKLLRSKNFLVFTISFFIIAIFSGKIIPEPYASRIMTIRSLVDYHTFTIDKITDLNTIDKFLYNGHYYSSKPPFLALVGATIYFILKTITGLSFNPLFYYIICLLTTGLAFALTMLFFYKSMRWYKISDGYKILFTFLLGFGTLFFPYSIVLHNHNINALLIFLAFYNILNIKFIGNKNIYFILVGFIFSLAIVTEPTQSAIIYVVFCLYILLNKKTRSKTHLVILSAIPVGILYMIYNMHTTGTIFPPYFNFDTLYRYPGSYWANPTGTDAFSHSKPLYIFNMLFGTQGILLYSPVLIFGFWGMLKAIKEKNVIWKDMAILIFASCLSILTFLGLTTYNYGGACYGFRWFVIGMPIVMFFVPLLLPYFNNKKFVIAFLTISFVSIIFSFIGIPGNWSAHIFTINETPLYFPLLDSLLYQFQNILRI